MRDENTDNERSFWGADRPSRGARAHSAAPDAPVLARVRPVRATAALGAPSYARRRLAVSVALALVVLLVAAALGSRGPDRATTVRAGAPLAAQVVAPAMADPIGDDTTATAAATVASPAPAARVGVAVTTRQSARRTPGVQAFAANTLPPNPDCTNTYTLVKGDSWSKVVSRAGRSQLELPDLLAANPGATIETSLYVGDVMCLPDGWAILPPTTTTTTPVPTVLQVSGPARAEEQAQRPAVTVTVPVTEAVPQPETTPTTAPEPACPYTDLEPRAPVTSADHEIIALLRQMWPYDCIDSVIYIAGRESGYKPNVFNGSCCYGLFQIYYLVHQSWLRDLGVSSASDLYDPVKNIKAAIALYERSGNSFAPWRL